MIRRLGVGGRLLLAFLGISAFALIAAIAAIYSFSEVGGALRRVTEDRMPAALASQELSRQAERVVAAAPTLVAALTEQERSEVARGVDAEIDSLMRRLEELRRQQVDAVSLVEIEPAINNLQENLSALKDLTAGRFVNRERRAQLLRELGVANTAAQRLVAASVPLMSINVDEWRRMMDAAPAGAELDREALNKLAEDIAGAVQQQKIQIELTAVNNLLTQAASAERLDGLRLFGFPLRRSFFALDALVSDLAEQLSTPLATQVEELKALFEGPRSILDARSEELEIITRAEQLLAENITLSRNLTEAVNNLVAGARRDIDSASADAAAVQRGGTAVLVGVVALSLISSGLIVWLYVGRNLVARLTTLSGSMLAIADGNLQANLPPAGSDEVGRMAEALRVFRDTAVEVEELNLRQIAEARQRLIDAIESISEGFSFYDKDDRLVLSNRRHREMLYPGLEDTVKPGTSFATTIGNQAERGVVRDAEGRIEEWIAERMQRHREPKGAFVQRRSNDRWIEVTEHRTSDGGTVAIYTDITDKKQSEMALLEEKRRTEEASELATEKNQMLESLSAKLSKYLSPQVYSSIFSGQQSVEISTKRKKLTVFFSDIAGFTEITENLESEELTGLLNNYLTEMSKIALEYGATIDKYIGDAIMLFFGDPETRGVKEDATACVKMAIAMQQRLMALQTEWRDRGLESPFQLRIGINTGYCTVGNFGSEDRMDYTIIGNEVNLASRLQTHADLGGILITHETYSLVKDAVSAEEQSPKTVKGFSKAIRNYRVAGIYDDLVDEGRAIHVDQEDIRIALNLDRLSKENKADTVKILKEILSRLED